MNSLGFGITITVSGNFEKALKSASRSIEDVTQKTKNLSREQENAASKTLKQAAAFGLLGTAANRLSAHFFNMSKVMIGALGRILKAGGQFQHGMLALKVFFGKDSDTMAGAVNAVAASSNLAHDEVLDIARRLGPIGLTADQATRSLSILAQAISTMSGQGKTRAIQGVANILSDTSSAARLLDTSFDEMTKKQIMATKGADRATKIIEALEKQFGNVFEVMGKGFNFTLEQTTQMFKTLFSIVAQPVLDELVKPLAQISKQLMGLVFGGGESKKIMQDLQEIFKSLISPLKKFLEFVAESKIVPRFFEFLAKNKKLSVVLFSVALGGSLLLGVVTKLAGVFAILTASILLFNASGIGAAIGSMVSGIGSLVSVLGASGLLGVLLAIPPIIGIVAGTFKAAFGPTMDFFSKLTDNVILLGKALFQTFSSGEIELGVFQKLQSSGLMSFFRIVVTIGSRLMAFINGIVEGMSPLRAVFQAAFDAIGPALKQIFTSIQNLLISFGLMQDQGTVGFFAVGKAIGMVAAFIIGNFVKAITFAVKAVSFLVTFVSGAIQGVMGLGKAIVGSILSIFEALANQLAKFMNSSIGQLVAKGAQFFFGVDMAGATGAMAGFASADMGGDFLAGGLNDLMSANSQLAAAFAGSTPASTGQITAPPESQINLAIQNQLLIDGAQVSGVLERRQLQESEAFNED